MPLRGLLRSPRIRPRKERRETSASRSSCVRNSDESRSCPRIAVATLSLVERLEVVLHLPVVITGHLLSDDVLFHLLPVLPEHAQVLKPRGHAPAAPDEVRVHAVLASRPRLALDADVKGIGAEALA